MEEDLSNLSREDLVKMLQKKSGGNTPDSLVGKQCLWTYVNNNKRCAKTAVNHWGFCETHRGSVQSLKAKAVYDEKTKSSAKTEDESVPNIQENIEKLEEEVLAEQTPPPKAKGRGRKTVAAKKAPVKTPEIVSEEESEEPVVETKSSKKSSLKTSTKTAAKTPAKTASPVKSSGKTVSSEKTKAPVQKAKAPAKGVQKPVTRTKIIKPNYWGRYEDPETGILFNPKDKTAYGIQDPTGAVHGLTKEHIKICIRNGWSYNDLNPLGEETEEEDSESEGEESEEESEESEGDENSEEEEESDGDEEWESSEEESESEGDNSEGDEDSDESEGESEEESEGEEDESEGEDSEGDGEDYEDVTDEEE